MKKKRVCYIKFTIRCPESWSIALYACLDNFFWYMRKVYGKPR